jgi:predicted dehydrogenase
MSETQPLRIGFCGVGTMGQCAHLKNYAVLDDCEVVAIAEPRQETGKLVAARYSVPSVYTDFRDMLANEQLDGIVASQPFERHGLLVPELLASGAFVFTEKPIAGTVASGEKIAAADAEAKGQLMVGYHKRSDLATTWTKAKIDELKASGELGKMTYVRILMPSGDWVVRGFDDLINAGDSAGDLEFDAPAEDMDADVFGHYIGFVNYYIHQVNLARHLLGESWSVEYAHPSGVLLAGSSDSGVAVSIEMTPYCTSEGWEESAMVAFERGYLTLELPAPLVADGPGNVTLYTDPGEGATPMRTSPRLRPVPAMRNQAINFLAAIRGTQPVMCTAADALADIKLAREYIRLWKHQ